MRHVVQPSMVAHLWANKSQDWAANRTRNFRFEGDTIYSYGLHFPIARHVHTKRGEAVLFTTRSYSSTTACHKGDVARACRHLTVFHAHPNTWQQPAKMLEEYRGRLAESFAKYIKARVYKDSHERTMRELVEEGNAMALFFGLRGRLAMPDLANAKAEYRKMTEREIERKRRVNAKYQKAAEPARIKAEEAEREYLAGAMEALDEWAEGKFDRRTIHGAAYRLPCRLRIVGENVETSRGADFPLDHGVKAFRFIRALHDKGRSWERNGREIRLGMFRIDAIDDLGNVKAGCHNVAYAEIERIAKLAGVE